MPVPWLAVGKLVISNLDTIMGVVKPAFTRKKVEAIPLPNQADLLNQQIAELQAAASSNAEQIKELAAQMKRIVTAMQRTRYLCLLAIALSIASLIALVATR